MDIAPLTTRSSSLSARLDAVRELGGFDPSILARFENFLQNAPEEDLFRMSPLRYALANDISDRVAIDLFLYATYAGVLEFNWGVICPGCAGFIVTPGGLRSLHETATCSVCNSAVEVSVDESVEVAFTVSPLARRIRFHDLDNLDFERDWQRVYFTPSRALLPEQAAVFNQMLVGHVSIPPDSTGDLTLNLAPGKYMIASVRHHAKGYFEVREGGTTQAHFDVFDGRFAPDRAVFAPGIVRLNIRNRIGQRTAIGVVADPMPTKPNEIASFEKLHHIALSPFLTGKQLATTQVFRELFRTESIPSELGLSFKSVTFMFSDLKGSTAMYERMGDIRAFQLVREHFSLIRDVIAELGGAVVKTMGDAVMGSFSEPLPALEAAILINRELGKIGGDEELILKTGIHTGGCIAVDSNDRLDYFGQTVNIAARVQGVAQAGEIVITEPVYTAPGAANSIRYAALNVMADRALLRGIDRETSFYRLS